MVDAVDPLRVHDIEVRRLVVTVVAHGDGRPRDATLRAHLDRVRRNARSSMTLWACASARRFKTHAASTASSVQISASTALAAAITSGLPLYVPRCSVEPSAILPITSARPPNAPIGSPPPMDFANATRSVRRQSAASRPKPAVMPVFTSSKMSIVPWRRVISLAGLQIAGQRETYPDVLHHRSTMDAAHHPVPRRARARSGSLKGMTSVSARTALVMPSVAGTGARRVGRTSLVERGLHRDHHFVVMTVVTAFDLHDLFAAGERLGDRARPSLPRFRSS